MNTTETDRDDVLTPPSTGIDNSMGYLLVGLGVAIFFCLMVFGMGRVNQLSTNAAQGLQRAEEPQSTVEIGGNNPQTAP